MLSLVYDCTRFTAATIFVTHKPYYYEKVIVHLTIKPISIIRPD